MRAWLEVILVSDTCFSSGIAGRSGDVDVEVEVDPTTGLPYLRGRALKGLLVEELAMILPALDAARWRPAAERLFGKPWSPQGATLWIGNGQLPDDLVNEVVEDRGRRPPRWSRMTIREALTSERRQTKVDPVTGGPEPHSLRATRVVRAGLSFLHPLDFVTPPNEDDKALLAACALGVRRAGLHRNRGWGQVRVRVLDELRNDVCAAWASGLMANPPAPPQAVTPQRFEALPNGGEGWVVSYSLLLVAPLVAGTEGGDPSAVETLSFVPGSLVLGALAGRFLAVHPTADAAGPTTDEGRWFRRLFLDGSTRWLGAFPELASGTRSVPTPRSLVFRKGSGPEDAVLDRACLEEFQETLLEEPDTDWIPVRDPFSTIAWPEDEVSLVLGTPRKSILLHHQRAREEGRPMTTDGAIFSYVSLDPWQRFQGLVLCPDGATAGFVKTLLQGAELSLGRSRSATYGGRAKVERVSVTNRTEWSEFEQAPEVPEGRVVVTLLSDFLGRDDRGAPSTEVLVKSLRVALGLPDAAALRSFVTTRTISGWVSRWSMPRPRVLAVAAGSVVVFERPAPWAFDPAMAWEGIGERRAEGFGRFAVDLHGGSGSLGRATLASTTGKPELCPGKAAAPSETLQKFRRNLLRQALRRMLWARAVEFAKLTAPRPAPSLVARLRGIVRVATGSNSVRAFLKDADGKRAGEALERARFRGRTLRESIDEWLGASDKWKAQVGFQETAERLGIAVDALAPTDEWLLQQEFLDCYLQALRRDAQDGG